MRALVEPAGVEVEAEQRASPRAHSARCAAIGNGPRGATTRLARLAARARARISAGSHDCRSPNSAVDLGAGHAGLVAVHQRVVRATGRSASASSVGLLARERAAPRGSCRGSPPSRWPGAACARRARSATSASDCASHQRARAARCERASRAGSRAGWRARSVVERLLLGARRSGRPAAGRCAGGAAARPSRPAPRRAPRCPWAASSRPGPSWRSTAGGRSGAAATSAGPARRRRRCVIGASRTPCRA